MKRLATLYIASIGGSGDHSSTIRPSSTVTVDLVALPGSPALCVGRTPVTVAQFRDRQFLPI